MADSNSFDMLVIGAGSGGNIFYNGQTITGNTTISTGNNWASIGPITINSGVTVTINSSAVWRII